MNGILHFDCSSGISGDMAVAAMLDLGADESGLREVLSGLGVDGFSVKVSEVLKSGVRAKDFAVLLDEDNRDHDPEYLYGRVHDDDRRHRHGRSYPEIEGIIGSSPLSTGARDVAMRILRILGEAESEAHGVPLEQVHFHEVGAVDSIVDIVSLAYCVDDLGFRDVSFSDLFEGCGTVRCQHGVIPVPVPAVVNIAMKHGIPLRLTGSAGEYVTPTGAAFAAAVRTRDPPESLVVRRVGTGAGKRESERSGILRAMVVEERSAEERILKLECNMDDCTGEALGHAMDALFRAGARDVCYTPVTMKKSRPGWLLTAVCLPRDREAVEEAIFRETSTVGIRRTPMDRTVLDREVVEVETRYGTVRVKVCEGHGAVRIHPEYDDVSRASAESGVPFEDVRAEAVAACRAMRGSRRSSGRRPSSRPSDSGRSARCPPCPWPARSPARCCTRS